MRLETSLTPDTTNMNSKLDTIVKDIVLVKDGVLKLNEQVKNLKLSDGRDLGTLNIHSASHQVDYLIRCGLVMKPIEP